MKNLGLIHIYYGDGKGKTTCATGLAVRAAGDGLRVMFAQFMKTGRSSELRVLETLPGIDIIETPRMKKFSFEMTDEECAEMERQNDETLDRISKQIHNTECDILVLDESLNAVHRSMLSRDKLMDLLKNKPEHLEVVLTGKDQEPDFIEIADYVSEIRKIKHPFDRGIRARKGIEF